jgi:hypothetical protein
VWCAVLCCAVWCGVVWYGCGVVHFGSSHFCSSDMTVLRPSMSSFPTSSPPGSLVKSKLDELFWEWLCLPESQKLVRQAILAGKGGPGVREDALTQLEHSGPSSSFPSPHFSSSGTPRSPTGRPSPTGSPDLRNVPRGPGASVSVGDGGGSVSSGPSSRQTPGGPAQRDLQRGALDSLGDDPHILDAHHVPPPTSALRLRVPPPTSLKSGAGAKEIPRFFFPRRNFPTKVLCPEATRRIREFFKQLPARPGGGAKGIITEKDMEPFVLNVLGVSKYFAAPVLQKMKVHFGLSEEKEAWTMEGVLAPSSVPLTEELVTEYCTGRIQIDDPVLTFFWMVKKDHADWIEREDFRIFMNAVLMKHPGLDFLQETAEFQDRYANTVISRIFFVYDRRDTGRMALSRKAGDAAACRCALLGSFFEASFGLGEGCGPPSKVGSCSARGPEPLGEHLDLEGQSPQS